MSRSEHYNIASLLYNDAIIAPFKQTHKPEYSQYRFYTSYDTNRLINADEIKCHYLPALFTINLMHSTAAILLQSLFSTLLTFSINAHFQYSDTINEHYLVNANPLEAQEIDMRLRQAGLPLELANLMTTTNLMTNSFFSTNQCSLRS